MMRSAFGAIGAACATVTVLLLISSQSQTRLLLQKDAASGVLASSSTDARQAVAISRQIDVLLAAAKVDNAKQRTKAGRHQDPKAHRHNAASTQPQGSSKQQPRATRHLPKLKTVSGGDMTMGIQALQAEKDHLLKRHQLDLDINNLLKSNSKVCFLRICRSAVWLV